MDKQFTAVFPREKTPHDYEHIEALCGPDAYSTGHMDGWNDCRRAMLEAQEKAVPVAFRYLSQQSSTLAWVWSGWLDLGDRGISALHVHCKTSGDTKIEYAYAHPNSSDTERLAEALRELADKWEQRDYNASRARNAAGHDHAMELRQALAAHSAQAQPPVQSEYAPTYPDQAKDPFWTVPGMVDTRPKTHGTQARPAASVTDAMVQRAFDKLLADGLDDLDRPKIEGMRAALEAALAAQENPNG